MASRQAAISAPISRTVLCAETFCVVNGAHEGDGVSIADDLVLDDVYALIGAPKPVKLSLTRADGAYYVAQGSEIGTAGARVYLDCALTLMQSATHMTEMIVLVETDCYGHMAGVYLLPLTPLQPKVEYRLIGIETEGAKEKFAALERASFTRGTRISLSTGRQVPVEDLAVGDMILTRDNGAQPLRCIHQRTERADGAFAPIKIAQGTFNNLDDFLVSPDHRLFFYRRVDQLSVDRKELLVRACDLINGRTVTVERGGYVDYFQLLFDADQIIFAEGIGAESKRVDKSAMQLHDQNVSHRFPPSSRDAPRHFGVSQVLLADRASTARSWTVSSR